MMKIMEMAMGFWGNFIGGLNQRQQIKAENRIKEANADAQNIVRRGNAELASAVGNLERWKQSVGNQRTIKQAALEQQSIRENVLRMRRDMLEGDLETRLSSSRQAGSAMAAMSASGVGGSTRNMINSTLEASAGRKLDLRQQNQDTYEYDALRQLTNVKEDLAYRLDDSMVIDNVDVREARANKQEVPSVWRTAFNSGVSTIANNPQGMASLMDSGASSRQGSTGRQGDTGSQGGFFSRGYANSGANFRI